MTKWRERLAQVERYQRCRGQKLEAALGVIQSVWMQVGVQPQQGL